MEITAEHFFDADHGRLRTLSKRWPLFVHGLGLSLGTLGDLDANTLDRFACVVEAANPEWISEHVAFTRTNEVDLGHLNPLQPSKATLDTLQSHARQLSDHCGKPLILENITSHLRLEGELSETDFLNQLCDKADCGLLLDVTNLFINSQNHRFDALKWLHELAPERIVQLHIVGYGLQDGRYCDSHAEPVQPELIELAREVVRYAPVKAVILERDECFPPTIEIAQELRSLEAALAD